MADAALDALYQEVILDHNRKPRNFHEMPEANHVVEGRNPNCGDHLTIWVKIDPETDVVEGVSFKGVGCAISKASASLMTQAIKGKSRNEANDIFAKIHALVTGENPEIASDKSIGPLRALGGVSRFPMRVKCASLAWHALKSALDGDDKTVTTDIPESQA